MRERVSLSVNRSLVSQVTRKGQVLDIHHGFLLVTLGITATSPLLHLPNVMLVARPVKGEGAGPAAPVKQYTAEKPPLCVNADTAGEPTNQSSGPPEQAANQKGRRRRKGRGSGKANRKTAAEGGRGREEGGDERSLEETDSGESEDHAESGLGRMSGKGRGSGKANQKTASAGRRESEEGGDERSLEETNSGESEEDQGEEARLLGTNRNASGAGPAYRERRTGEGGTLELTRLFPLQCIKLSVHDRSTSCLKLHLASGRSFYLQLVAPLGQERQLFEQWGQLIYMMRWKNQTNNKKKGEKGQERQEERGSEKQRKETGENRYFE
ncbi:uncharacterized protein LOC121305891 [Polyodon spathula]|uniref:uncharacterized protein LOC121305891 n=1 Tax=Polyodon spathula TaxID=7913 RepID=UPI001B7EACBF|nr:uncharacterized protein LOC121305891 [Polyodon spathula]